MSGLLRDDTDKKTYTHECDLLDRFNPATILCLSQAKTSISNGMVVFNVC